MKIKQPHVLWELLQIKSLHNRCKRMETIVVSWQNGIRFSVKRKLSLHNRFPSKLSWNEYIVSNWRYHCKIVFKVFHPKHFATCFYPSTADSFRCKWRIVSVLFRKRSIASGLYLYRFKSVVIPLQNRCFTKEE
jgi:hypothetical protein